MLFLKKNIDGIVWIKRNTKINTKYKIFNCLIENKQYYVYDKRYQNKTKYNKIENEILIKNK